MTFEDFAHIACKKFSMKHFFFTNGRKFAKFKKLKDIPTKSVPLYGILQSVLSSCDCTLTTMIKDKMVFMDTKHNTDTDININGPGVITVDKVHNTDTDININGPGVITVDKVHNTDTDININGPGVITVDKVHNTDTDININGPGAIMVDKVHNTDTDININGPGVITVDKVHMTFIHE